MMRLDYFPLNDAYAFHFGDAMLRLEDKTGPYPMFFQVREDAVEAARSCGLHVGRRGQCSILTLTANRQGA